MQNQLVSNTIKSLPKVFLHKGQVTLSQSKECPQCSHSLSIRRGAIRRSCDFCGYVEAIEYTVQAV